MFAAGEAASKAKAAGLHVISPQEIEELGGNKGKAKKIANAYDFFLSEVPHMGLIGRYLGVVLGPRGKMPRPVPPTLDPAIMAAGLQSTVVIKSGDKMTFKSHLELQLNPRTNFMPMLWKFTTVLYPNLNVE